MRKLTVNIVLFSLIGIFAFMRALEAYWVWTPETKKFINPKYAVKDSPKEQFEWAMSFYDAKDYQRAATEFEKLAKQYEFSEYASKAQYYVGLCYENMQKYYIAFQNYQKAIDNFPHIANTEEIIAREFVIGSIYLEKDNPKVLGTDIMAPLDRAVEIFKKVVENAPYGKYAEDAQFKLGEALKKSERYEEAVQAFHKLIDDYPNSQLVTKAMFEEADCAYKASLRPAYDSAATASAIKTFEKFVEKNKEGSLATEADKTIKRLKDNVAEKSFRAAEFYGSQGKTEAAIIYYQDVANTYPDSYFANQAKAKIEQLKNKKDKKASSKTDATTHETPKKKEWKPLSFGAKKEEGMVETPKAESTVRVVGPPIITAETQIAGTPEKEEVVVKAQEAPKEKSWKPLSFNNKKKDAVKKTPRKKEWKPLSFGTKEEWKPLMFDTKKSEEAGG